MNEFQTINVNLSNLSEEERKALYKKQKLSGTVVKAKKIGRNDPCP